MEQLSLFENVTKVENKEKIDLTVEIKEELLLVLSQTILNIYKEGEKNDKTDKNA